MTSVGNQVVGEVVTVAVFFPVCGLCDYKRVPGDPHDKVRQGCRSVAAAQSHLAMHRRDHHVADWYPDDPRCELCGESGPIEVIRENQTTSHYDVKWERNEHNQLVRVDRSVWKTNREQVVERLERDDNIPFPLPDRYWHTSCHTRYLRDAAIEDEIDNQYEARIKEERAWVEMVQQLIASTEEGVLWSDEWKRIKTT